MSGEGNPCHDEKGQFCSGPSSGGGGVASLEKQLATMAKTDEPAGGKFTDGPTKMLETQHGWVEPLPKGSPKKVPGGFTGYKVMDASGKQVGEVWRNPSGSEKNYTAFDNNGEKVGLFDKKVHAIAHLATVAKGGTPPVAPVSTKVTVASIVVSSAGTVTTRLSKSDAPSGMTNVVSGHAVQQNGKKVGEVWAAEHKTEKKTKYWTKKEGSGLLGKSHNNLQSAIDHLVASKASAYVADLVSHDDDFVEPKITSAQRSSLRAYSSVDYENINNLLRSEGGTRKGHLLSKHEVLTVRAHIADMDEAMRNNVIGTATLHAPTAVGQGRTLYRAAKVTQFGVDSLDKISVGMELQNHAFVSTSRSRAAAKEFMKGGGHYAMMEIRTGPKSHGIDMRKLSTHKTENEVLLPRKSKFRVVKIVNGVIHVEHVDPH